MEKMSKEELIDYLSSIENVEKDYRGQKRRYYRMRNTFDNKQELIKEALLVLFPDCDEEMGNPNFVKYHSDMIEKKMEVWDGVVWIRTILV